MTVQRPKPGKRPQQNKPAMWSSYQASYKIGKLLYSCKLRAMTKIQIE